MLSIDAVELRLQAISRECESLRQGHVPAYMMQRSLRQIEEWVTEVRAVLSPALSDLSAFYRVSTILAQRMTGAPVLVETVASTVRATLVDIEKERRYAASVQAAAVQYDQDGEIAPLAEILPAWTRTEGGYLLAAHLTSLGLLPGDAQRLADALVAHHARPAGDASTDGDPPEAV